MIYSVRQLLLSGGIMMKKLLRAGRGITRFVLSGLLGALLVVIVAGVITLNNRPDLSVWHTTVLDAEFNRESGLDSFDAYLELEDRLFRQLDEEIYQRVEVKDQRAINRYSSGSLADPARWPVNWNRSFVLAEDSPRVGVLLLHGMSDSPYSLRSIGQFLHERGAYVIGLRIPGHGQAPSGLLDMEWEDMAAAVRLAMGELQARSAGMPMFIVGYSNGGALAVNYALDSLTDESLAKVSGLVLLSPEIGISKMAALAKWQERLGHFLGLEKLAWNSLLPEYDPWKYGSFALNAGKQAYRITSEIQRQITAAAKTGKLDRMPSILAFQSVVDSTITAPALVNNLFDRLPANLSRNAAGEQVHHELVLFDINRWTEIGPLLNENPSAWIDPMLQSTQNHYWLTLLSNQSRDNQRLVAASRKPGSADVETCDTGLSWPMGVYSLSHVALPIPPNDPVYGGELADGSPGIELGNIALRGEKGILQVPAVDQLRLRYNPFHSYIEFRMLVFMGFEPDNDMLCAATDSKGGLQPPVQEEGR
jgi:alpha-beta hydrolase superfamily lysophospholipase